MRVCSISSETLALAAAVALVLAFQRFSAVDLQLFPQRLGQVFSVASHDSFQFGFDVEEDRSCQIVFGWRWRPVGRRPVACVCAEGTRGSGQIARGSVALALAQDAALNGKGDRPHPVVEGLAEFVDGEFFQAQQDQGFDAAGYTAAPHGPAGPFGGSRQAALGEHAQRPLDHRMGQVEQGDLGPWREHTAAAHLAQQRVGIEGKRPDPALNAVGTLLPHRLVDGVAPTREIGAEEAPEVVPGWSGAELRSAAAARRHGRFERVSERPGIEVDLGCQRGQTLRRICVGECPASAKATQLRVAEFLLWSGCRPDARAPRSGAG